MVVIVFPRFLRGFGMNLVKVVLSTVVVLTLLIVSAVKPAAAQTQLFIKTPTTVSVAYNNVQDNAGGSGFSSIRLYFKKDSGAWTNTGTSSNASTGSLSYLVNGVDGTFYLSAQVTDLAGNISTLGVAPSLVSVVLDTVVPTAATITAPASSSSAAITLQFAGAADSLSGVASVALWSKKAGGVWAETGLTSTASSGSFSFTAPSDGTYRFTTVVTDASGNSSATPSGEIGAQTVVAIDLCPSDPLKTAPMLCGCGVVEDTGDSDSDGIINCLDTDGPTVALSSTAASITNASSIAVTVTFNRSVTGFIASDLVKTNATVTNFAGSGASYSFTLTPTAQGTFSVSVPAGAAVDAINGRLSTASTTLSRTYDSVVPTYAITSTAGAATNVSPIPVTVTFSENVTGFATSDLTIVNATVSGFAGSGKNYTFNLIPTTQGVVSVTIKASSVQDAATNTNAAGSTLQSIFDTTAPASPSLTVSLQ